MTNSFINIITSKIIIIMIRMMINDVRPTGVNWIVEQSSSSELGPDKILNITNSLR